MHLLIPPDTRPPTLALPVQLAKAVGLELRAPPPEALNRLNLPGDWSALHSWLSEQAKDAELLIVNLEQLTLGGMIPARRVDDSLDDALAKLELLKTIKQQNPRLRVLAFGVIVRVAHGNDPLEEKLYYGEYGDALRRYSEAFDRFARHGGSALKFELQQAIKAVPHRILSNWLETRQRNHQLHLTALEYVKQGVIEHLCLTLDDTSSYGLAAHDRRALEAKTDKLGLWRQVDIYPGADEVPVTLLARALQRSPARIYVRYSSALGAAARLIFEDRPVGELIKAQLRAAGCRQVDTLAEADAVLAVNTPGSAQAHTQPDFATVDTAERHLPEFIDFIAEQLGNKPVSLADIAYPNGAERRLMELLTSQVPLSQLAGFSGWNTAGNTLGSAIAMAVLYPQVQHRQLWLGALFNRLVDDYLYQADVRPKLGKELAHLDAWDLGEHQPGAEARIDTLLKPKAEALWQQHFAATGYQLVWQPSQLAWPRLFTGVFPFEVRGG